MSDKVKRVGCKTQMALDQAKLDRVKRALDEVFAYCLGSELRSLRGLITSGDADGAETLLGAIINRFDDTDLFDERAVDLWHGRKAIALAILDECLPSQVGGGV